MISNTTNQYQLLLLSGTPIGGVYTLSLHVYTRLFARYSDNIQNEKENLQSSAVRPIQCHHYAV